jgi:hypothetical protein
MPAEHFLDLPAQRVGAKEDATIMTYPRLGRYRPWFYAAAVEFEGELVCCLGRHRCIPPVLGISLYRKHLNH